MSRCHARSAIKAKTTMAGLSYVFGSRFQLGPVIVAPPVKGGEVEVRIDA